MTKEEKTKFWKDIENRYPDKDAGVQFCDRCNSDQEYYYTYWPQKHGYYIKFCKGCNYGPYMECPEAMPELYKSQYVLKNGDQVKYSHGLTMIYVGRDPLNENCSIVINPNSICKQQPELKKPLIQSLPTNRLTLKK